MITIKVKQNEGEVEFKFNDDCWAGAFDLASTCLETGGCGTQIIITADEEEE